MFSFYRTFASFETCQGHARSPLYHTPQSMCHSYSHCFGIGVVTNDVKFDDVCCLLTVEDIESAMRLPADEFYTNYGFTKPLPTQQPIITYCRSGKRANVAAKVLIKQFGFPRYVCVQLLELGLNVTRKPS